MRDHWARTAHLWVEGAAREAWLVPLGDDPGVATIAARAAPALELPHLDPVPARWLHLTLVAPIARTLAVRVLPPTVVEEGVILNVEAGDSLGTWPHVALAYANGDGPAPDLDALGIEPITATVATIVRARLRREAGLYTWDVLERVPLRASK